MLCAIKEGKGTQISHPRVFRQDPWHARSLFFFFLCRFGNQCLLWWLVVKLKTTSFECYAQMCNQRRERYPNLPPSIFSTRSLARNITTCSSLWQSMITVNTCCVKWAKSTLFLLALHRDQFLMPWKICFISRSTMQDALLTCFLIKSKKSVMQSMQTLQRVVCAP